MSSGWRRCALLLLLTACGGPERDNPADPGIVDDQGGIEIIASITPDFEVPAGSRLLTEVTYTVTWLGMKNPVAGTLNLVGARARGVVQGVPDGADRVFLVEGYDNNRIRTFSARDTVDVSRGEPASISLTLERLTGGVELTSQLPPEIVRLTVAVVVGVDTTTHEFTMDSPQLQEVIREIPTGTGVQLLLRGLDDDGQVLVSQDVRTDVRDDLLARVSLPVFTGAVSVTARFPDYLPLVSVDRFSDSAAVFYRRSDNANLPDPGEPIDFDQLFLHQGLGPNQERIEFYHLDVRSKLPGRVYVVVNRFGEPIPQQLPIFEEIPGEAGYTDLRQVVEVRVTQNDFQPNSLVSLADIEAAALDTTFTQQIMNCAMVPDGSTASRRFDPTAAVGLLDGWYRGFIVRYLLFENPQSQATVEFGGLEISAPQMYAFFQNDREVSDGFAVDADGLTHNVFTRLPQQEGYSPLWVLRVFKLSVFDRVISVASAQDNDQEDNILELDEVLIVNAPVVHVGAAGG